MSCHFNTRYILFFSFEKKRMWRIENYDAFIFISNLNVQRRSRWKDLDTENQDAFIYINNLDIHNLCLEKKQTRRISMQITSIWRRSRSKGSGCLVLEHLTLEPWHPQPPSGEEAEAKNLNTKNWDAYVFISNLNIHNLHPEKKQTKRILMPRTRTPSSSLTTMTSPTLHLEKKQSWRISTPRARMPSSSLTTLTSKTSIQGRSRTWRISTPRTSMPSSSLTTLMSTQPLYGEEAGMTDLNAKNLDVFTMSSTSIWRRSRCKQPWPPKSLLEISVLLEKCYILFCYDKQVPTIKITKVELSSFLDDIILNDNTGFVILILGTCLSKHNRM